MVMMMRKEDIVAAMSPRLRHEAHTLSSACGYHIEVVINDGDEERWMNDAQSINQFLLLSFSLVLSLFDAHYRD